jgi:hypothetical protein
MPISVTFIGDKRPLHDIAILAEHGYGEDAKGNNVPLPEEIRICINDAVCER